MKEVMTMVFTKTIDAYWRDLSFTADDLEFLYNFLLEKEEPLTDLDLAVALISERLRMQRMQAQEVTANQKQYFPKEHYEINDHVFFPQEGGKVATVKNIRDGLSLTDTSFNVMEVEFSKNLTKEYVIDYEDHPLNILNAMTSENDEVEKSIVENYGAQITKIINEAMDTNNEIVCIGGKSFPQALLVDINTGYLNLAEALLEMEEGGPLSTLDILKNLEFPFDDNSNLTEFSMNYALQEDPRFDEVGPAGETFWFLQSFEPDYVKSVPPYLKANLFEYEKKEITDELNILQESIFDEWEFEDVSQDNPDEVTIHLIFPHWRAGTLPLSYRLRTFFPIAFESENVLFTFVDELTKEKFPGWVIFKPRYVFGLRAFYKKYNLIPGSIIRLKKSNIPGEIIISLDSTRTTRDWLRTANVNTEGNLTFNMLKQVVPSEIDERMAIALPESLQEIEEYWGNPAKIKQNFEKFILSIMRELSKLNPQGHVHIAELYAAVNMGFRCPPGPIISALHSATWATPLGNLYYRLETTN
ncbi:MAG: hypothetical protein JEZ00_08880 [Anaerolineaceae bacterium]|nr:hypothetical protein [Anaerolineaceae bacterium]